MKAWNPKCRPTRCTTCTVPQSVPWTGQGGTLTGGGGSGGGTPWHTSPQWVLASQAPWLRKRSQQHRRCQQHTVWMAACQPTSLLDTWMGQGRIRRRRSRHRSAQNKHAAPQRVPCLQRYCLSRSTVGLTLNRGGGLALGGAVFVGGGEPPTVADIGCRTAAPVFSSDQTSRTGELAKTFAAQADRLNNGSRKGKRCGMTSGGQRGIHDTLQVFCARFPV